MSALLVAAALLVQIVPSAPAAGTPDPAVPAVTAQAATCASSAGPGIPPPASVPSGIAGFHAAWYGQSGYPSLCPGDRATAVVAYHNSGSLGWVAGRMGEAAYLGTWEPDPGQDRPTVLGGDGTRGSPSTGWPRYDRVAVQPAAYVGPGQVAWFLFTIQAPPTPGIYRSALRPLVEGATWMEDYGVFWDVTVLNADGSRPTNAMSAAAPTPIELHSFPFTPATYVDTALGEGGGVILVNGTSGTWTSPWHSASFAFTRLVASWNADTPAGTWIDVEMQARDGARETRWYSFGRWAYGDGDVRRASVAGQSDGDGSIATDTFLGSVPLTAYRIRVTLSRAAGSFATPSVRLVAAVASDLRD
ncbi:MAG: hypothetical protein AAB114_03120, partial [Chloroflexota bacterium]